VFDFATPSAIVLELAIRVVTARIGMGIAFLSRLVHAFEIFLNRDFQARSAAGEVEVEADGVVGGPVAEGGVWDFYADNAIPKRSFGCGGGTGFQGIDEAVTGGETDAFGERAAGGERRDFALVYA
jgi:hypothetical protein